MNDSTDLHKRNFDLARTVSDQWHTIRHLRRALATAVRINSQLHREALRQQERADAIARDMDELVGVRDG